MKTPPSELSERKKLILKAIVEAYIELGEPVGSKYVMNTQGLNYSSATIRNEMAELEEMGYLEQPHTSAGRIPSELGYRFYVDSLIEGYDLTAKEIGELKSSLAQKQSELDHILNTAMQLASSMTNYTALAVKPRQKGFTVRKFNLMSVDEHDLVLVMVTSIGEVKTKNLRSDKCISPKACLAMTELLNERLVGLRGSDITLDVIMDMENRMGPFDFMVSPIVKAVYETVNNGGGGELRFDGVNRLLEYPDVYNSDSLQDMLTMFEDKDDLIEAISDESTEHAEDDNVRVYIGSENVVKNMNNSTLIFKPITKGGKTVGAIGIIGPIRMDYSKVIAMIDQLTKGIDEIMNEQRSLSEAKDGSE